MAWRGSVRDVARTRTNKTFWKSLSSKGEKVRSLRGGREESSSSRETSSSVLFDRTIRHYAHHLPSCEQARWWSTLPNRETLVGEVKWR